MTTEKLIKEIEGGIKKIENGDSVALTTEELASKLGVDNYYKGM
ncbi:hypothetical protein [Methanobrevibacter curvatus]|uniref:Uncharacterized protein n=1 Tax=Methanobrevibacter curvatus TaxID=49547 RepID=A0A162FI25_9EURY|nr:hypothetical protein [Methanobrevibacter curvatus]KZX10280.1 hypothetical protein MBCUR_18470 [Methanobrevibacter curvatus]